MRRAVKQPGSGILPVLHAFESMQVWRGSASAGCLIRTLKSRLRLCCRCYTDAVNFLLYWFSLTIHLILWFTPKYLCSLPWDFPGVGSACSEMSALKLDSISLAHKNGMQNSSRSKLSVIWLFFRHERFWRADKRRLNACLLVAHPTIPRVTLIGNTNSNLGLCSQ